MHFVEFLSECIEKNRLNLVLRLLPREWRILIVCVPKQTRGVPRNVLLLQNKFRMFDWISVSVTDTWHLSVCHRVTHVCFQNKTSDKMTRERVVILRFIEETKKLFLNGRNYNKSGLLII